METQDLFALTFVAGIAGGLALIWMTLQQRTRHLEMLHRERIAMIERGQVPPAVSQRAGMGPSADAAANKSMSVGIILVGLGLGLATLIGLAAESPNTGLGVGGAVAILGAAFIAKSLVVRPASQSVPAEQPSDPTHQ